MGIGWRKKFDLNKFRRDEDGGITIFIVLIFLTLVLATGMAVDFMRHEMARADLQNALDRGVLAAADVDQSLAQTEAQTKALVQDYMKSRSYKSPVLDVNVSAPTVSGGRVVTASARYQLNTFFLNMIGMDTMSVPAQARAQQNASRVEISLILDVSNSMRQDSTWTNGTRLTDLQAAAKQFVDTVLTDDVRNRTFISIVPYSAQVNLPDEMAAAYNIDRHHGYANCVNFDGAAYSQLAIPTSASLEQSQHFFDSQTTSTYWTHTIVGYKWVYTRWGWRQYPVYQYVQRTQSVGNTRLCPESTNQILPYSNSNQDLRDAIDALDYEGWTAAYTGMKWGAALLDPAARPLVTHLVNTGAVSADFSSGPSDYTDGNTRKIVILMTDGRNTRQYKVDKPGYGTETPAYWNANTIPNGWLRFEVDNENDGRGDQYLNDMCSAVKAQANTIVYTIGFELASSPDAATVLRNCASSASTHYMVEGVDIGLAFSNIAANIAKLRLTL